jgi:arylsulfatase A-like enzyme
MTHYLIIVSSFCLLASSFAAERQPNIVLILADDLGYADLGCYGNRYHQTPHMDRLMGAGMRFTQAYSDAPLCAPSRIALLSGRHAAREGCYEVVAGRFLAQVDIEMVPLMPPENRLQLPADRKILPERLKALGYRTGVFGKWHVGPQTPAQRGFDDFVLLGTASHLDAAKAATRQRSPDYPEPRGYSSDYLTACARRFLDKGQGDARPFFLYLPYTLVHTCIGPNAQLLEPKPELFAKYAALPKSELHGNPSYAAMVEALDQSVGEVMGELERRQLLSHTVIILTSDNGGLLGKLRRTTTGIEAGDFTSNHPLRDGKATLWEGGIRIPFAIRFDGRIPTGRVSDAFVSQLDLMPTLLALAGDPEAESAANGFDGRSLVPLFRNSPADWPERALCWHYPNYRLRGHGSLEGDAAPGGQKPSSARRHGDWKLIENLEDGSCQLFNLAADVSEERDVSREHPETVAQLKAELADWRKETRAPMPVKKEPGAGPQSQGRTISLDGEWQIGSLHVHCHRTSRQ